MSEEKDVRRGVMLDRGLYDAELVNRDWRIFSSKIIVDPFFTE
jgi:hypothetical protein